MDEILFEVRKEHLETGLRGIPVGYCTTSSVDAQEGLCYAGRKIEELTKWSPEQVIYLLYHGKEGTDSAVKLFFSDIKKRAKLLPETVSAIYKLPRKGHPMQMLAAAVLILDMEEKQGDYREDCLHLLAKMPLVVAHVINHHANWKNSPSPESNLGYIENFTYMLQVPDADKKKLQSAFRLFHILHCDHGGGNLSTFVTKAISSSLADSYESVAGGILALSGPRHGKANQDALFQLKELSQSVKGKAEESQIKNWITKLLENQGLVYGFGHAVLRKEDPRATAIYHFLEKEIPDFPLFVLAKLLRTVVPEILKTNPKIANPYPNVDAISGVLLAGAGFDYPEYFPLIFALSRTVGWTRQIIYERCEAREGKGTPIVRPKYLYKGPSFS